MPLTNKIKVIFTVIIVLHTFFSGCILDDLFGGTSFSLVSWNVINDEDFASLNITFSSSENTVIKLPNPNYLLLDSELYYRSEENQNAILNLAESRHSVVPGQYKLLVYDEDNNEIFSQKFTFKGSDLSILSCTQKWWEHITLSGRYSLFGLELNVKNNGDVPSYPYKIKISMDSEEITGFVIPCVVMPGENKNIKSFIYRESEPENITFDVYLQDIENDDIATNSFSVNTQNIVPTKKYEWYHNGKRLINVPRTEFLIDYYTGLDRINIEDYSLYVFDQYDDIYLDIVLELLMKNFFGNSDLDKINYIASFVQNLEYKNDDETNSSYEYPRYPVETLFNGDGGGDCEDLSILLASLLNRLNYDVALLRIPNHMAVGVNLSEDAIPNYEYYTDNYYFLETTTVTSSCGYIPPSSKNPSELDVYPISIRPLIMHSWKDGHLSIYTIEGESSNVKITIVVQNLGISLAKNIIVKGAFYTRYDQELNSETITISSLEPFMKKEVTIICDVPLNVNTWFKTRIYYNNEIVDEHQSVSSFP